MKRNRYGFKSEFNCPTVSSKFLSIPESQPSYLQNGDKGVCLLCTELAFFPSPLFSLLHQWLLPTPPHPRVDSGRVYIVDAACLFWFPFKVPRELSLVRVLRITDDSGPLVPKCVPDGHCRMVASAPAASLHGVLSRKGEAFQGQRKKEGVPGTLMQLPCNAPQRKLILLLPWAGMPGMLCKLLSPCNSPF